MERDGIVVIVSAFIICLIFHTYRIRDSLLDDERIELEGVFWKQNIWRSNNLIHEYEFIQGRNQADLKLLFHPIGEKGYLKNLGFIDGIDLRFIGREWYDFVYNVSDDWGASGGFFSKEVERD